MRRAHVAGLRFSASSLAFQSRRHPSRLTSRSSRPRVVASAVCFTLRLHTSAAPPQGGLTPALGAMADTRMHHKFVRINYADLNNRQKENFNYQKIAAVLADFGFVTMRLSDDWHGADFIAQHINGQTLLRVQLKSRLCIDKKYLGKDLHICFPADENWYFVPHDEFVQWALEKTEVGKTYSWKEKGVYSVPHLPEMIKRRLRQRCKSTSRSDLAVNFMHG
jgi:hypothetical protein